MTKIQTQFNRKCEIVLPPKDSPALKYKEQHFNPSSRARIADSLPKDQNNLHQVILTINGILCHHNIYLTEIVTIKKLYEQQTGTLYILCEDKSLNSFRAVYYHNSINVKIGDMVTITGRINKQLDCFQAYKIEKTLASLQLISTNAKSV